MRRALFLRWKRSIAEARVSQNYVLGGARGVASAAAGRTHLGTSTPCTMPCLRHLLRVPCRFVALGMWHNLSRRCRACAPAKSALLRPWPARCPADYVGVVIQVSLSPSGGFRF